MGRMIRRITLLAAALMLLALPVLADEGTTDKALEQGQQVGKDECLLASRNCKGSVDTIQQRIDRIQKEIGRGPDVYTNDELRKLNRDLEDALRNLDSLTMGS